jgi:ABC-type sugar transport system ATPase subunit
MTLLELEHVGKSYSRGSCVALDDLSLVIDAGEMVVVWGERQSGRSTLLRIAAGVETPSSGVVRFDGRELAAGGREMRAGGIGYCHRGFRRSRGPTVLEQLLAGQFARRVSQPTALTRAWKALGRVNATGCAPLKAAELKVAETTRVAIARALTSDPRLLVVDEPTIGLDPLQRDSILKLLRSLAKDGVAILASAGDGTGLLGADRVLSLGKGKLYGELTPDLAPVTELDRRRQARGGSSVA